MHAGWIVAAGRPWAWPGLVVPQASAEIAVVHILLPFCKFVPDRYTDARVMIASFAESDREMIELVNTMVAQLSLNSDI